MDNDGVMGWAFISREYNKHYRFYSRLPNLDTRARHSPVDVTLLNEKNKVLLQLKYVDLRSGLLQVVSR